MPTAVQTPIRRQDEATRVGPKRYRKQILPVGEVPYEGKTVKFSKEFLRKAADTFNDGAYDQVPFQLADPENRHNMDPEKFRGEITALELSDEGLYGVFDLSDEGAALVAKNPKLGVSCRIVQDHPKGPAIRHVLGTLDPRATGMGPWEKLDLAKSPDDEKLIDLSDGEFRSTSDPGVRDKDVEREDLTDDERKVLDRIAAKRGVKKDDGDTSDVDKLIASILDTEKDEAEEKEPVALSEEAQKTVELAKSTADDAKREARQARDDLAKANWKSERRDYALAGVPPSMLDLAEPHLSSADSVVELSKSDFQASAMRKMLEEAKGTVDLSERGSGDADDEDQAEEAKRVAKEWDEAEKKKVGA